MVGVPVISPVVALRDNPAGSIPTVTLKLRGEAPPTTVTVADRPLHYAIGEIGRGDKQES
jgi:hypothetical protein